MGYTVSIIGGGSLYTLPLLRTICSSEDTFRINKILMYDEDEKRQRTRYQAAEILLREISPHTEIIETKSLEEAVDNVDYVLIQIRTGGLDMRESDEKTPLLYGCIGQETCGAGGLMYGMRSIRDTLKITDTARRFSPDSWIINFSNPASILSEAVRRYWSKDNKIVYLCDMPILMLDAFESALQLEKGTLRPRYFGLNHFGWFTNLYDASGRDRIEEVKESLRKDGAVPEELKKDADWVNTFKRLGRMVKDFDGFIPSTYLEYYFYPKEIVKCSDPRKIRARTVKEVKQKNVENICEAIIRNGTTKGSGLGTSVHGKYILDFIEATLHPDENREFLIPVKNDGAIPNLDKDATVEIPCIVARDGVKKLFVGEVDTFYKGLIENQYASEKLVVDGVLENDLNKCLKGFVLNRMIHDTDTAKALLADMLIQNEKWLPELCMQSGRLL